MARIVLILMTMSFQLFAMEYSETKKVTRSYFDRESLLGIIHSGFGDTAKEIFKNQIYSKGKIFGGPCDLYEQVYIGQDKLFDDSVKCFDGKSSVGDPFFGVGGKLRAKNMIDFCSELSMDDKVFANNFANYKQKKLKEIVRSIITKFYGSGEATNLQVKVVKKLEANNSKKKEKIRQAIMAICLTEEWQLI